MRPELFIANRLYFDREGQKKSSRPAVKVALLGMIIGVLVMVLTLCVVVGFKRTITDKVACFGAHIQLSGFESNNTFEKKPVVVSDSLLHQLSAIPNISRVETFLTKPGIIKTEDSFQGVVLKGKDKLATMEPLLVAGRLPETEQEVLLSQRQCQLLKLEPEDKVYCYFVGEDVRVRRFVVSGVYATGLQESDELFVWCKSNVIRRLNEWDSTQVSGVEMGVKDVRKMNEVSDQIWLATANRLSEGEEGLYMQTLDQLNPQIFSWLDLLDMNVAVIIVLMLCVSGFNIISGLIILILDSISMIGILKALGATNRFVKKIFMLEATLLIGKGLLWGNVLGLGIAAVQYFTHWIPLEAATYYVDFVPTAFPWLGIVLLNVGVVGVSLLILLAPAAIITKISPARVMRWE